MADGFDDAIIGMECSGDVPRVVYSIQLMVHVLCERDSMTEDDAIDFINYNVVGAYVGEGTPIYVDVMNANEIRNYNFN